MTKQEGQRGVTLIELLVVLAILALVGGAIVLNMPPARGDAKLEAERFAARFETAASEAIVGGRPLRLEISSAGYSFARYVRGEWSPVAAPSPLSPRSFAGMVVSVEIEDSARLNEPAAADKTEAEGQHLVLDAIGGMAPFTVDFADRRERWQVVRGSDGLIEVRQIGRS